MHHKLEIPQEADILICAGDGIQGFSENEFPHFLEWYASLPAKLRIFVAGNHEIFSTAHRKGQGVFYRPKSPCWKTKNWTLRAFVSARWWLVRI
ncbi:metallophosphoesterase [Capnocytophaga sp.]|uniref:metallophosphoesterase n=1 Tax=Capnocytophaga sp. TaxID=44737 RepID=UPI0034C62031